jgi:hypothetical protein
MPGILGRAGPGVLRVNFFSLLCDFPYKSSQSLQSSVLVASEELHRAQREVEPAWMPNISS